MNENEADILVVDDNPDNLRLLTRILGQAGYQVRAALNGITALKSAYSQSPDLILLDIKMPEMDGFEVCLRLKSTTGSCDIPVLFLSALQGEEDKLRAFQAGAVDYITKPFSEQEVLARVDTHLRLYRLQNDLEQQVRARTAELELANRAYRALSHCNQAVLRAADEMDLYREACRIIQRDCGCRLVWIGVADYGEDRRVLPVAQCGFNEDYLSTVDITWADNAQGRGPTGTAIRTGQAVVNRDVLNNPAFAPWREQAIKYGYHSSVAIPLKTGEAVFGALNLYADYPDAFSAQEIELLSELAENLAYGILILRVQAEQRQMEQILHENEEKYRILFNNELLAVAIIDPGSLRFLDANQTFCRLYGYTLAELLDSVPVPEISAEPEQTGAAIQGAIASGEAILVPLRWHRKKDGTVFPVEIIGGLYTWHARRAFFVIELDIGERVRAEQELDGYRHHLEELVQARTAELEQSRQAAEAASAAKSLFSPI